MALIKCPECNSQISSHAKVCPKCGMTTHGTGEKNYLVYIVIFMVVTISILIVGMTHFANVANGNTKEQIEATRRTRESIQESLEAQRQEAEKYYISLNSEISDDAKEY